MILGLTSLQCMGQQMTSTRHTGSTEPATGYARAQHGNRGLGEVGAVPGPHGQGSRRLSDSGAYTVPATWAPTGLPWAHRAQVVSLSPTEL